MNVEQIDAWLASKGVTLWQSWNISDPVQRRKAAVWFVNQQDDFDAWDRDRGTLARRSNTSAWDVVV